MEPARKALIFKLFKTVSLIIVWACLGLFSEITGVTLQDLKNRTESDYEIIGQAVSMRMVGYGAGALFGGWLLTRLTKIRDLVLGLSLTIAALLCVAIAYSRHVELLFAEFIGQGIMETMIAIAGQQSLVSLWQEKASGPMHILHLGYGAGSFLVPQIAKPFLSKRVAKEASKFHIANCLANGTDLVNLTMNNNITTNISTTSPSLEEEGRFEMGYIIVMCINLCIAALFFGFHFCTPESFRGTSTVQAAEEKRTLREIFSFHSCSPGHPLYAAVLFIFIPIWFYIAVGGQMIFANYLYSYTRDELCVSVDKAADIQSTFWVGFTLGRFSGFIASIFVPMKFLLFIEAIGNMISALVLYFFSANITVLWVFSCISGLFVGPLYPSGIAWANRYLTMTGLAYTITLIGGSLAGVSFTVAIGYFFEHNGPRVMWYFVMGYSVIACVLAVCMHLVARTRGDKFKREAESEDKKREIISDTHL